MKGSGCVKVTKIRLSKPDAATRQIVEAIQLFFEQRDPVAVHALTVAAYEVASDLLHHEDADTLLRTLPFVRVERRKEVREILRAPGNFFKHAAEDPGGVIDFNPEVTPHFIFATLIELQRILGDAPMWRSIFMAWFYLRHPQTLDDTEAGRLAAQRAREPGLAADDMAGWSRFFREHRPKN